MIQNPREAAYLAALSSARGEKFVSETLDQWRLGSSPASADYHLAQQIAIGATQMALALDYLGEQLSAKKKLSLKLKERVLLRIALYQFYYLDRIPLYAITDESIKLAYKYCHRTFAAFLNASLRKLADNAPKLPQGDTPNELSIRYSYPIYFVEALIRDYGIAKAKEILEAGNTPAITMTRVRTKGPLQEGLELFCEAPRFASIKDSAILTQVSSSPSFYIQNVTPAFLIAELAKDVRAPGKILDLCSSPGGKLLSIHDLFSKAALFANDVSEEKLKRIKENCAKYGLDVQLSCGKGENFQSQVKFDIIILDVPCSNSGVLNKRPEARWRLSEESLKELEQTQLLLLQHAISLLSPQGEIWYLTCSILKDENEKIIKQVSQQLNLHARMTKTILPSNNGWDGGFACSLRHVVV